MIPLKIPSSQAHRMRINAGAVSAALTLTLTLTACTSTDWRAVYRPGLITRTAGTGSMYPTLNAGTPIIVVHQNFARITAGDIVLRRVNWNRVPIVHRAVARFGGGWITRGDSCPRADPGWMLDADFVAVVKVVDGGNHQVRHPTKLKRKKGVKGCKKGVKRNLFLQLQVVGFCDLTPIFATDVSWNP